MDYLWQQRHSSSDLLGTVINVHNGDWIRRGRCSVLTHGHSLPDFHYDHPFIILKCVYHLMISTGTWLYNYDKPWTVFWELLCHFLDFFSIILFIMLSKILILTEALPWTVMASVGIHSAQIKIFLQNISQKKRSKKKNCHPFNISIFSLAKSTKIWNLNVPGQLSFWMKFNCSLKFPYANTDLYFYVVWYSGLILWN